MIIEQEHKSAMNDDSQTQELDGKLQWQPKNQGNEIWHKKC